MLKEQLNIAHLLQPTNIIGVAVYVGKSAEVRIEAVTLTNKKKEISIEDVNSYNSYEDLFNSTSQGTAFALSIEGKGVIIKKLIIHSQDNDASLLNRCLPNASTKDFYLFTQPANDSETWVSIIRKELFDALINQFISRSNYLLDVSLGPFYLPLTFQLYSDEVKVNVVKLNGEEIQFIDHRITEINKKGGDAETTSLKVDGKILKGSQLTALGNAMNFFIKGNTNNELPGNLKVQVKEFEQRKLFGLLGKSMMGLLFFGLLINFFLFDHYSGLLENKSAEYSAQQSVTQEIQQLYERRDNLKAFVEKRGLQNTSSITYCADQIGASIPLGMTLTSMDMNPRVKAKDEKEAIQFTYNELRLKGEVGKSITLNDWINQIKKSEWVGEVAIIDFKRHPKTGMNEFELLIKLIG